MKDDALDLIDRVAGSFVLLYAQRLSRISRNDIAAEPAGISVRFGRESIELIPPITALVERLVEERRSTAVGSPQTNWLFRGQAPGEPISAAWIG